MAFVNSMWRTVTGLVALAIFAAGAPAAFGINATYQDGGVHTVESPISFLDVKDGPAQMPTTVNVVPGGDVAFLNGYGASNLNVSGGEISHLSAYNSSHVNISGGIVSFVNAYDATNIVISGGDISQIPAYDNATVSVSGVYSFGHVVAQGSRSSYGFDPAPGGSRVDVYSGNYYTASARASGVLHFRGGDVLRMASYDAATANVYDGNVTEFLTAYRATTNVYGGQIASIYASQDGTVNVYGGHVSDISDGFYPTAISIIHLYGTNLSWSGVPGDHVVGTLADNSPIDAPVSLQLGRLELHAVPEPSTLMLVIPMLLCCTFCAVIHINKARP